MTEPTFWDPFLRLFQGRYEEEKSGLSGALLTFLANLLTSRVAFLGLSWALLEPKTVIVIDIVIVIIVPCTGR